MNDEVLFKNHYLILKTKSMPLEFKEVKEALKGIDRPIFIDWVFYAFPQGYLDLLAEGLIKSSVIKTPVEVIPYYADLLSDDVIKKSRKVTHGDLSRTATCNQQVKKLKEKITGEKIDVKVNDKTRRYGTLSHTAITALLSGDPLIPEPIQKNGNGKTTQGSLFSNDYDYDQLAVLPKDGHKKDTKRRKLTLQLMTRIEKNWRYLAKNIERATSLVQSSEYQVLRKDLLLIFDDHMRKVADTGNTHHEEEYLCFLTFMSWAAALVYFKQTGSHPMFKEVPVLRNSSDVAAGRIDVLRVMQINNLSPNKKQTRSIQRLTSHQFDSVGRIIRALRKTFGTHLDLKIRDWKFAIGDGPKGIKNKLNIINAADVIGGPLPEHEKQMKRYLSTSILSHSLVSGFANLADVEKLWETKQFTITGELVYFFPHSLPVIHQVVLTKDEVRKVFKEQIVGSFFPGQRRAKLRMISSLALKHATQVLDGKSKEIKEEQVNKEQLSLGVAGLEPEAFKIDSISMESIVKQYYESEFKDETETIEIMERIGKREYLGMHYDKLLDCIFDKKTIIASSSFTRKGGGKICCPYHGESTASCNISLDILKFHCFGCGLTGDIILSSVPADIEVGVGKKTIKWELQSLVIPPRHREIMACAQEILHGCFWGSKAEMYLHLERGLNPRGSYSILNAGFADDRLIKWLLGHGFTMEELYEYGFIDFGSWVSEYSSTVSALKWAGYTVDKQRRIVDEETFKLGLPYSVLEDTLTYPLEIHKVINSFYGRSVNKSCPKPLRHKKVRSKITKMKHGGVNISWATESKAKFMLVLEAAINMDTMMQISTDIKNITAVVGVNNLLLTEFLASYEGDIILGLDYDQKKWNEKLKKDVGETGQKNTIIFRDRLKEYGFKGNVYDFTGAFVKNNPGIIYNDPNQYWLDYRKPISVLENLQEIPKSWEEYLELQKMNLIK